ncbi:MAG: alpha-galactosidase [bacterium]|nr:alpha-galactosidase [bacterium]
MMKRLVWTVIAGCMLGVTTMNGDASAAVTAREQNNQMVLQHGTLAVHYDLRTSTLDAVAGDVGVVHKVALGAGGTARLVETENALGTGKGVAVTGDDGWTTTVALYEGVPFLVISSSYHNAAADLVVVKNHVPFDGLVPMAVPASDLHILGCDGLTQGDTARASYTFLAAAQKGSRAGCVAGWLTHNRGSGIVFSQADGATLRVRAEAQFGTLRVAPGGDATGETFVIGYFDDALIGLEAYADATARVNGVVLRTPIPSGYCTWYSNPHGGASNERHMAELAEFCARELTQFGFDTLQIDDKWQIGNRDFTTHKPKGPYRSGMTATADTIHECGMQAGIWYIPFGWDPTRPIFADHQDWFVTHEDGSLYEVHWAGTCLDMTHPNARAFLHEVVARMAHEWHYDYFKVDGLWTGMATGILYPEPTYRDDDLGGAVFHDPMKTNMEAYRDGLALVRDAAGDDVFILGCNIAQNMRTLGASYGRVDGMRVGRDIGADWGQILPCVEMGTRLYFMHGRIWYNDPDCLMLREPLTLDQARAWTSWIAVSGQLNLVSEWLPGLPPERLDLVKRSMPNHGLCGRPIDLFDAALPQVWQLTDTRTEPRRDVVALFNWDADKSAQVAADLTTLDLPESADGRYVGFEYWSDSFLEPFSECVDVSLAPSACNVIAVRPWRDYPQVVSTSRHITQGIVDLIEETWDAEARSLGGCSQVVAKDPYELRVAVPEPFKTTVVEVSDEDKGAGVQGSVKQDGANVRACIESPTSRQVRWTLRFE